MHIATMYSGRKMTLTPPTSAISQSSFHIPWQARWNATIDDEHAVSTERLGPRKSYVYDSRFERIVIVELTAVCDPIAYRFCGAICVSMLSSVNAPM